MFLYVTQNSDTGPAKLPKNNKEQDKSPSGNGKLSPL